MKLNFPNLSLCGDTSLGKYEVNFHFFSLCGETSLGIYEA
jgi:hypothetical protein